MPNDQVDATASRELAANLAEFDTPKDDAASDDFMSQFSDLESLADDTPPPAASTPGADPQDDDGLDDLIPDVADPDATPAVKPEAVKPAEDEFANPPGKQSAKTREHWDKLRDARAEALKRAEAAEARLSELDTLRKEAEELKRQLADLPTYKERAQFAEDAERELSIARVEGSREFKAAVLDPLKAIEDNAVRVAKANNIPEQDLLDALSEPDPDKRRVAVSNLLSGLEEYDKQEVIQMVRDTQTVMAKAKSMRENAAAAKAELEKRQQEAAEREAVQRRSDHESRVDKTVGELRKRIPFVPLKDGETPEGVFQSILDSARKADIESNPHNRAFAATAAVLLPRVNNQLVEVLQENKTLKARVAELTSARPGITGDPAAAKADEDIKDEDVSGDAFARSIMRGVNG